MVTKQEMVMLTLQAVRLFPSVSSPKIEGKKSMAYSDNGDPGIPIVHTPPKQIFILLAYL